MSRPSATAPVPRAARLAWAALLLVAALTALAAVAAPARIGPSPQDASGVSLDPPVARAADGDVVLRFLVGSDAAQDVLVSFSLHGVLVDGQGQVTATPGSLDGATVGVAATRLRPGEQLEVPVAIPLDSAALLAAEVTAAAEPGSGDAAAGADPVRIEALVLSGLPDEAPALTLGADGVVTATASSPTLVSLLASGRGTRLLPARLLVPDAVLTALVEPAAWPRATTAVITTETGTVVRSATATGGLRALATAVLLLAVVALVATRRTLAHRQGSELTDRPS